MYHPEFDSTKALSPLRRQILYSTAAEFLRPEDRKDPEKVLPYANQLVAWVYSPDNQTRGGADLAARADALTQASKNTGPLHLSTPERVLKAAEEIYRFLVADLPKNSSRRADDDWTTLTEAKGLSIPTPTPESTRH